MTREEAKKILRHIVQVADTSDCGIKEIDGIDEEAIDMAIKALQAQADGEKTCGTCRNKDTYHCAECENKSDWEDCNEFYNWDAPIRKRAEEEKNCDNCGKLKYHCQECGVNLDNWTPKQTDKIKAQAEVNAHAIQSALDNGTNTVIGTAQADNIPVMYYPQVDGITPTVVAQADGEYINRILNRMWNCRGKHTTSIDKIKMEQIIRDELSSVNLQKPCRDIEEMKEVMNSDADAETKCKMISNILTAKPHYFEEPQERSDKE